MSVAALARAPDAASSVGFSTPDHNRDAPRVNIRGMIGRISAVAAKSPQREVNASGNQELLPVTSGSTVQVETHPQKLMNVIQPTKVPAPSPNLHVSHVTIQEWEGYVVSIQEDSVFVNLLDITANAKTETAEAEIPLSEFSAEDQGRLQRGSIFRWALGIQRRGSTQTRTSQVVLRHLPAWSKRDIDTACAEGLSLSKKMKAFAIHADEAKRR